MKIQGAHPDYVIIDETLHLPAAPPLRLTACKKNDGQLYYIGPRKYVDEVSRHMGLLTVEVDVTPVPDDDTTGTHWGWQYDDGTISMIWPTRATFDAWTEPLQPISAGRPVRLAITPAPHAHPSLPA
jgi:hypothetical protein